jgi:putative hydrolase of the HAD superfamily
MTIKAVFFDAAGTLIKPARRVGESYAMIANKYGVDLAPSDLTERFRLCFDASPPLAFPDAAATQLALLERDWWKDLVARVFAPWGTIERFDDCFSELFEYFAGASAWTLYPEVAATLDALKERGLILDVISNFDSRLHRILAGLGIADRFDEVFVSSAVGHAKPDARIFQAALRKHGLAPGDAAHIGDSETNDVRGAREVGLKAILVDRSGHETPHGSCRVTDLNEILPFLFD